MIVLVNGMRISKDDSVWEIIKEYDNFLLAVAEYQLDDKQILEFKNKSHCRISIGVNTDSWDGTDFLYLLDSKKSRLPAGLDEQIRDWKINKMLN